MSSSKWKEQKFRVIIFHWVLQLFLPSRCVCLASSSVVRLAAPVVWLLLTDPLWRLVALLHHLRKSSDPSRHCATVIGKLRRRWEDYFYFSSNLFRFFHYAALPHEVCAPFYPPCFHCTPSSLSSVTRRYRQDILNCKFYCCYWWQERLFKKCVCN